VQGYNPGVPSRPKPRHVQPRIREHGDWVSHRPIPLVIPRTYTWSGPRSDLRVLLSVVVRADPKPRQISAWRSQRRLALRLCRLAETETAAAGHRHLFDWSCFSTRSFVERTTTRRSRKITTHSRRWHESVGRTFPSALLARISVALGSDVLLTRIWPAVVHSYHKIDELVSASALVGEAITEAATRPGGGCALDVGAAPGGWSA
jgi:hypothetical protein